MGWEEVSEVLERVRGRQDHVTTEGGGRERHTVWSDSVSVCLYKIFL